MLADVTARTEYIADMMQAGTWHSRRSPRELGKVWDVAESTIRNYSAEAGRSLEAGLKEERVARAVRAADRLELLAITCANSPLPGDAGAAVRANELLLRMTGFAEPEEDKARQTTLVQIGQVVTSPVFKGLLAGHEAKRLNGETEEHSQPDDAAEGTGELPVRSGYGALVGAPPKRD